LLNHGDIDLTGAKSMSYRLVGDETISYRFDICRFNEL